jgi:hypothetical protein
LGIGFGPLPVEWTWTGATLSDVVVVSRRNAWAVGEVSPSFGERPLVSRLVGDAFRTVATPLSSTQGSLAAVTAVGGEPLAVGYVRDRWGHRHPLAMLRRDGRWRVQDTAAADLPGQDQLVDVDAVSSTEAWAVGLTGGPNHRTSTVLRWNGVRWRRIDVPLPEGIAGLAAIDARASGEVWAVGSLSDADGLTYVLHRDGTGWHLESVPEPPGAVGMWMSGVAAASGSDVWLVGQMSDGLGVRSVAAHRDGTGWTTYPGPDPGSDVVAYTDVTLASDRRLLAIGSRIPSGDVRAIVETGSTSDTTWTGLFPDGQATLLLNGADFVNGTDVGIIVGASTLGGPVAYRDCAL